MCNIWILKNYMYLRDVTMIFAYATNNFELFSLPALTTLVECVTGLERILRTPIPLAYSVHLHQAVWLYLLSLPYQMVGVLDWFTIPAVTLASFALLRILGNKKNK